MISLASVHDPSSAVGVMSLHANRGDDVENIAAIDFKTAGLSPVAGERATEIAAVLVRGGKIVDHYQSLMNVGLRIPSFIEHLTGISSSMVRAPPAAAQVTHEVANVVGDYPLVAHKVAFDRKFCDAEFARIRRSRREESVCSMLIARRPIPDAPNHKLGTLIDYAGLPVTGRYRRAHADAEMAAYPMLYLERQLEHRVAVHRVTHVLLAQIHKIPRRQVEQCMTRYCAEYA